MFIHKLRVDFLKSKFTITMFLFLIGTTYLSSQDEVTTEQALQSLAFRVMIVIIAAVIAFISRALLILSLNKLILLKKRITET